MLHEIRYALRQMLRRPGWTALARAGLSFVVGPTPPPAAP